VVSPTAVAAVLTEVAMNPKVHDIAGKLVSGVYGRIMGTGKQEAEALPANALPAPVSNDELADLLRTVPQREEIAAAFAILQAELDRRNTLHRNLLIAVLVVQGMTVLTVAVLAR
jgi:hypothetical protein